MKIKTLLISLFAANFTYFSSAAEAEKEHQLLFHLSYDSYSTHADFAAGKKECRGVADDLQLRMHPGVAGKGNGLCLNNQETCVYSADKNLTVEQGTISLWVAPKNWKASDKQMQCFFQARLPKGVRLLIYKFKANVLRFGFFGDKWEHYIETRMKDSDWEKDRWHKLDAVWDSKELRLYVDGKLAKKLDQYSKTLTNPYKLKKPLPVLPPTQHTTFTIGIDKGFFKRKNDLTAYDEVKIYSRPLPATEIWEAYEKFYPQAEKKTAAPLITVPHLDNHKLSGKLSGAEWVNAASVPVANAIDTRSSLKKTNLSASLKHDGKNLYIGVRSNVASKKAYAFPRDDDQIWQVGDVFEFHCLGNRGHQYQFIVTPGGSIWDARTHTRKKDIGKAWNSNCRVKATAGKDGWTAELVIPFSDLGYDQVPKELRGNFCFTLQAGAPYSFTWSKSGKDLAFSNAENFGKIVFDGNKNGIFYETIGNLENGKLDLKLKSADSSAMSTEATLIRKDGYRLKCPGNLLLAPWNVQIPAGDWTLTWTVFKQKKIIAGNAIFFRVDNPLTTTLRSLPSKKIIEIENNLAAADANILKQFQTGGLNTRISLIAPDKRCLSSVNIPLKDMRFTAKLPLPDGLKSGDHIIKTEVIGKNVQLENETTLFIPDMTPFKKRIGYDHQVIAPWTPVKSEGKGWYSVLNRRYKIDKGPFPVEIESESDVLLKSAPVLLLDTGKGPKPLHWGAAKTEVGQEDYQAFSGTGNSAGNEIAASWNGELWFDGFWKTEFALKPAKNPVNIRSLSLEWSVPEQYARYVLDPLYRKWDGKKMALKVDRAYYHGDFLVWTTGTVKGLAWMPFSMANWANRNNERQVQLSREKGIVRIRVNIISRPVTLTKQAVYRMSYMATPGKPFVTELRNINNGNLWGETAHENVRQLQGNPHGLYDYTLYGETLLPVNAKRYKAHINKLLKKNIRIIPYSQPAATIDFDPYHSYFYPEWAQLPGATGNGGDQDWKTGRIYSRASTCAHTKSGDLAAWRAERILNTYPDLGGLYYDISQVCWCSNQEHGHGGIDAFGNQYMDSTALSLREFFLRVRKITHRKGKLLFLHAHNRFIPAVHGFADVWYPGEEYHHELASNPAHFYCEDIPMEVYQSAFSSQIRGCNVMMITFFEALHWNFPQKIKKQIYDAKHALTYLTPCLVHDISTTALYCHRPMIGQWWGVKKKVNLAAGKFHGYWFDRTIKSSPKVKVSWYSWEKTAKWRYMLVAGNFTRRAEKAELNLSALPVKLSECVYQDLWTGKTLTYNEVKNLVVQPHNFRLIGIAVKE